MCFVIIMIIFIIRTYQNKAIIYAVRWRLIHGLTTALVSDDLKMRGDHDRAMMAALEEIVLVKMV